MYFHTDWIINYIYHPEVGSFLEMLKPQWTQTCFLQSKRPSKSVPYAAQRRHLNKMRERTETHNRFKNMQHLYTVNKTGGKYFSWEWAEAAGCFLSGRKLQRYNEDKSMETSQKGSKDADNMCIKGKCNLYIHTLWETLFPIIKTSTPTVKYGGHCLR